MTRLCIIIWTAFGSILLFWDCSYKLKCPHTKREVCCSWSSCWALGRLTVAISPFTCTFSGCTMLIAWAESCQYCLARIGSGIWLSYSFPFTVFNDPFSHLAVNLYSVSSSIFKSFISPLYSPKQQFLLYYFHVTQSHFTVLPYPSLSSPATYDAIIVQHLVN